MAKRFGTEEREALAQALHFRVRHVRGLVGR